MQSKQCAVSPLNVPDASWRLDPLPTQEHFLRQDDTEARRVQMRRDIVAIILARHDAVLEHVAVSGRPVTPSEEEVQTLSKRLWETRIYKFRCSLRELAEEIGCPTLQLGFLVVELDQDLARIARHSN